MFEPHARRTEGERRSENLKFDLVNALVRGDLVAWLHSWWATASASVPSVVGDSERTTATRSDLPTMPPAWLNLDLCC
nr:hypothetical protein Iba_chr03aCG9800 [Ipomoea batatas]